eukprot:scaffold4819_cov126-Amphora_coffeaeformis.AAC.2
MLVVRSSPCAIVLGEAPASRSTGAPNALAISSGMTCRSFPGSAPRWGSVQRRTPRGRALRREVRGTKPGGVNKLAEGRAATSVSSSGQRQREVNPDALRRTKSRDCSTAPPHCVADTHLLRVSYPRWVHLVLTALELGPPSHVVAQGCQVSIIRSGGCDALRIMSSHGPMMDSDARGGGRMCARSMTSMSTGWVWRRSAGGLVPAIV